MVIPNSRCAAVSPDGRFLITGAYVKSDKNNEGLVVIQRMDDGSVMKQVKVKGIPNQVAMSKDGNYLAIGTSALLQISSFPSGLPVWRKKGNVYRLRWNTGENILYAAVRTSEYHDTFHTIHVRSFLGIKLSEQELSYQKNSSFEVNFSSDGKKYVVGTAWKFEEDEIACLNPLEKDKEERLIQLRTAYAYTSDFTEDSTFLAIGTGYGDLEIWNMNETKDQECAVRYPKEYIAQVLWRKDTSELICLGYPREDDRNTYIMHIIYTDFDP